MKLFPAALAFVAVSLHLIRMRRPPTDATGVTTKPAALTDDILPQRFMALLTTGRSRYGFLAPLEIHLYGADADPRFIRYRLIGIPGGSQVLNAQFLQIGHIHAPVYTS